MCMCTNTPHACTIVALVVKMKLCEVAHTYFKRLQIGLDDVVFKKLAGQSGGSLLVVARVDAGFERVTTECIAMNEGILEQFIDNDPDMHPLQKTPLRHAFQHLDEQNGGRLSGTRTKHCLQMWSAAEAEKLCLMWRLLKKETRRSPSGSKCKVVQKMKAQALGKDGPEEHSKLQDDLMDSDDHDEHIPNYPDDGDDDPIPNYPSFSDSDSEVESVEPTPKKETPAVGVAEDEQHFWEDMAGTLGWTAPNAKAMGSMATLASLKIDARTPVPKTKIKKKQKKNGGKPTKKDAGKLMKKPMATDAGKPTIVMTHADKPMKTDAGKCDNTEKLSHLMTVYLKTMKRKPGTFDDKPPKVKMKMECNCTLHQVTTPGKIYLRVPTSLMLVKEPT